MQWIIFNQQKINPRSRYILQELVRFLNGKLTVTLDLS